MRVESHEFWPREGNAVAIDGWGSAKSYKLIEECIKRNLRIGVLIEGIYTISQLAEMGFSRRMGFDSSGRQYNIHLDPISDVADCWKDSWIAFPSSGSTGEPKLVGFTKEKLHLTLNWYEQIYPLPSVDVIATELPMHYHFPLVAGYFLGRRSQIPFLNISNARELERYRNALILANPLTINSLLNYNGRCQLFVDSGGAPLSTGVISRSRQAGIDLREGYGMTETCSLTHFDGDSTSESLGTVGSAMEGVVTSILGDKQVGRVIIESPNAGIVIRDGRGGLRSVSWDGVTSEIGRLENGRLRILGRFGDNAINGKWPREVLDFISEEFPLAGLQIMHPSDQDIIIQVPKGICQEAVTSLAKLSARFVNIPENNITVTCPGELLHSMKLPRGVKSPVNVTTFQK